MYKAGKWIFALFLPVMLLTASLAWAMNSQWWYTWGFQRYDIRQVTGLEQPELQKAADGLIRYFNSGETYITLEVVRDGQSFELFNEREVQHLKDVKGLFRLNYRVLLGTSLYVMLFAGLSLWRKERRRLAQGLIGGSVLTLALVLALGIGALLDFDRLFWQFHLLSFANDFWLLDPTRDYLVMLFPQGFWYDSALLVVGATALLAIIAGGLGYFLLRRGRRNAVAQ